MPIPTASRPRDPRAEEMRSRVSGPRALALALALVVGHPAWCSCQQESILSTDTVTARLPRLSLESIIALTLGHSPAVDSAIGTIRNASAARRVAGLGAYLPALLLNGLSGRSNQSASTTGDRHCR